MARVGLAREGVDKKRLLKEYSLVRGGVGKMWGWQEYRLQSTGLARGRIDKSFTHCARPGESYLVLRWQFFQTFFVRTGMALEAYLNELPGCFHSLFYLKYGSLVITRIIREFWLIP